MPWAAVRPSVASRLREVILPLRRAQVRPLVAPSFGLLTARERRSCWREFNKDEKNQRRPEPGGAQRQCAQTETWDVPYEHQETFFTVRYMGHWHRAGGVSSFGDLPKPSGHDSEQRAVGDPA